MGCFVLPKKITSRINAIQRDFWWGKHTNSKGIYIKSNDLLCKPIELGGLGFKEASKVNRAMVSKIAWRIVSNPDNLCTKILKDKYLKTGFLQANNKDKSSWIWNCIYKV